MPTINTGSVGTADALSQEKKQDMDNRFKVLDPETSQFMTMLMKLPSNRSIRERIEWEEDELLPNYAHASIALTPVATSIALGAGEGAYFEVGDRVKVAETGEVLIVTAISTDTLTVTRAAGSVIATGTTDTTPLYIILPRVYDEGADVGALKQVKRVLGYNYQQIFRNPFGFTGTQQEIALWGNPSDPAREAAKKAVEHKRDMEHVAFFGVRSPGAFTDSESRTAGGLYEAIVTRKQNAGGTLTYATLDGFLRGCFNHGSYNKVIFASPLAAGAMSALLTNNWVRARPDDNVFGAKVNSWVNGAYGTAVPVIVKREWGRFAEGVQDPGNSLFVVDLDFVEKRTLRSTRLLKDRQSPGVDAQINEYLTECSFVFAQEKTHGYLFGITG